MHWTSKKFIPPPSHVRTRSGKLAPRTQKDSHPIQSKAFKSLKTVASGSSDSRRGSAGVHFSENVQIRLYRRKSVFNPSPRPNSKPRPRTLSGNGDFDSPSVFTFD